MSGDGSVPARGPFGMKEENVARRIVYEMQQRGWSQERLAKEMSEAGYPIHQSAISKIVSPREGKRRTIGVEEAIGFARVFGTSLESLALPLIATKSAEVKVLVKEISDSLEQRVVLLEETSALWRRLRELLSDADVVDAFVKEMEQDGWTRQVALHTIYYWVEGSFIKGEVLDAVHPAEVAHITETLAGNIEALRKFRDLLLAEEPVGIEDFLDANEEPINSSGLPLASRFMSALRQRLAGEQPHADEIALAVHWIDLTIRSVSGLRDDIIAMRKREEGDSEAS